ncbi:hypothetical protein EON82_24365 [bacterium]|nr:MAG: hypothetical protein EON82_24365 [bacterium]
MEATFAALSEGATVEPSGRLSVLGVVSRLRFRDFPHLLPRIFFSCGIAIGTAERLQESVVEVELIDPDGRRMHTVVRDRRILVGSSEDANTLYFNAEIRNLSFPEPGDYQFSIRVDGALLHAVGLAVERAA